MTDAVSKFETYHRANPHVYDLFKKFTLEVIGRGFRHYGAHDIIHRIRWETNINTHSEDGFKISNGHFPFYARMFMRDYPQYRGFFRTRTAAADYLEAA